MGSTCTFWAGDAVSDSPWLFCSQRLTRPLAHQAAQVEALLELHCIQRWPSQVLPGAGCRDGLLMERLAGLLEYTANDTHTRAQKGSEGNRCVARLICEASNIPQIIGTRAQPPPRALANAHDVTAAYFWQPSSDSWWPSLSLESVLRTQDASTRSSNAVLRAKSLRPATAWPTIVGAPHGSQGIHSPSPGASISIFIPARADPLLHEGTSASVACRVSRLGSYRKLAEETDFDEVYI